MVKDAIRLRAARDDAKIFLMYHELESQGRPLCQSEQGYLRYVVGEPHFREQMDWLRSAGIQGLSVTDGLKERTADGIVITFDDGCESDLAIAAPILRQANFGATFFITVGFLGRPGYLIESQVRELGDAGFDIGCHSMTHPYLSELSEPDLNREIVEARDHLQQMTGHPVRHFSCPGGRWSPQVAEVARRAGYQSVSTSQISVNRHHSDHFQLARIAVMRGTELMTFQRLCRGHGLWQRRLRSILQSTAHRFLGNTVYDRVRSFALGDSEDSSNE